jgi:hypothetical protein
VKTITFDIRTVDPNEYECEMTDERYAEWASAGYPDEWLIEKIDADFRVGSFTVEDA